MYGKTAFIENFELKVREAGYGTEVKDIPKVNGGYKGLCVWKKDSKDVVSVLPLQPLYARYREGDDVDQLTKAALEDIDKRMSNLTEINALFADKADLSRVQVELINTANNFEVLKDVPHMEICDLSVIFRLNLGDDASVIVNSRVAEESKLLENAAVPFEKLLRQVEKNYPPVISHLSDVIEEMTEEKLPDADENPAYVVTTGGSPFGAAVLAYRGFLMSFAEKIGGAYWILPSSLYEVLIVPDEGAANGDELFEMVCNVNKTVVSPADVLSDNVYYFDPGEETLSDHFGREYCVE